MRVVLRRGEERQRREAGEIKERQNVPSPEQVFVCSELRAVALQRASAVIYCFVLMQMKARAFSPNDYPHHGRQADSRTLPTCYHK